MDGSGGHGRARGRGRATTDGVKQGGRQPHRGGGGNGNGRQQRGPPGTGGEGGSRSTQPRQQQQQQQQQQPAWGRPQTEQRPQPQGRSTVAGSGAISQGPRPAAPPLIQGQGRATLHRHDRDEPRGAAAADPATAGASRGAMRGKRIIYDIIRTRPATTTTKRGKMGTECSLQANFFRLIKKPTWCLYQYRVDFSPDIDVSHIRKAVLGDHKAHLGGYIFDGTMLFLTMKLPNDPTEYVSQRKDGTPIKIDVKFVALISMTDGQSLQILNLILRRAMEGLKLQLVGRNFFDALAKIDIRDFNLQLWPGYTTSIRQHEQDILLCAEITHKVMRTDTLLQILQGCTQSSRDYQDSFKKLIMGTTVLTDYNNKTYRIDDVDFNMSPLSTFKTRNGDISFLEYYKTKYNITIRDQRQPVLLSQSRERDIRAGQSELIILIPELCRATGLTDQMRGNFHLMKAMGEYTRLGPGQRIDRLKQFNKRLANTEASIKVLNEWQMQLDSNLVEIRGRMLPPQNIVFGGNKKITGGDFADWTSAFRNSNMFSMVNLERWFLLTPQKCQREANDFSRCVIDAARGMGMRIAPPKVVVIQDDHKNYNYVQNIETCCNSDPQLLMIVCINNNAERYSCIKKKTCCDRPIATQVMVARTITPKGGNVRSLMSVATKVAIQINCKLGGLPWNCEIPLNSLLILGFDVCHSTRDKSKSYGALVAHMVNKGVSKYFSTVTPHHNGEELSNQLSLNVVKALAEYRETFGELPKKILFYRDGVGEGQIHYVVEHEVNMVKEKLDNVYRSAFPDQKDAVSMAFVVVSKRISTRLFWKGQNPNPGTVVDDIITLPERYDFYLVSQSVRQGTVSPTSYNIIYDTFGLDPDKLQLLTYRMCHLYYNWSGTTRVPAVCQYAHKLAFLVGQSIHQNPVSQMEKSLYFL